MKHSLAHNAAYNMAYQLLNLIFPLISAGYISRVLAPEGVGRVAYAQNIVSYFVMFAALGIPSYGTREIARYQDDLRKRSAVFSELLLLCGISTSVCLAVYGVLGKFLLPGDSMLYMAAGLELVFCYVSIDWLYRGLEEYGYITVRNILVKVVSLVALLAFVKDSSDYVTYAFIHCLGIGCNHIFNIVHARKYVTLTASGLSLKRHLKPILWLMASSVAASLYSKVGITMLGILADAESVAYYSNANKVIGIVLGLVTALSAVFLPRLSYVYTSDRKKFTQCITDGLEVVLLLAVPACAGICLVADNLMECLFGPAFRPGGLVLRIFAVFTIVKGAGDLLCYQVIISSGNEKYLVKSRVVAGVINIILNAVLIPAYAHGGAAIASVISELIVNGMLLRRAWSIAQVKVSGRYCFSVALGTAVMVPAVSVVQKTLGAGIASLAASVAFGILSYGIMLVLTKNKVFLDLYRKFRQKRQNARI